MDSQRRCARRLVLAAGGSLVSLLVYNGQDVWRLASDPLGRGSDLFGTATATIDYSVVSATAIWYVQVGALVVGHVGALVLGHDRALELYRDRSGASRSQLVMLVLMVCFTVLGLWLLSEAQRGMIVFAHASHWLIQAAYLAPLVALVWILMANQLRERREGRKPRTPSD